MVIAGVGIYQDKKGNNLIIPYWHDKFGIGRQSIKFDVINENYNEQEIGNRIINKLEISKINEQEEVGQNAHLKASGLKSWNASQKKYENVNVSELDSGEWNISRYLKKKDHSYGLDKDEVDRYKKRFPEALSAAELGKVVLEMFAME